MNAEAIQAMRRLEDDHWWFNGRRSIVGDVLRRLPLPAEPRILEAGCGTGGNLAMLNRLGRLWAFEPDAAARALAEARALGEIAAGALPDAIPFGEETFDLAVATDVLEHVERDGESVRALGARLRRGGWLVATVPACPWLWSGHDVSHQHFRRYTRKAFAALFGEELELLRCSHFNSVLFPPVAAVRKSKRLLRCDHLPDTMTPPSMLNATLQFLFSSERYWLRWGRLPLGVSLLAVARRR